MASYAEKLKDPRWQKKRLEIFQRDDFMCQLCNSKERTLHVHHTEYSGDPWEADDNSLITYCELCHEMIEFCKTKNNPPPYKTFVIEELKMVIGVREGKAKHIVIFDSLDGEMTFRAGLKREWIEWMVENIT